MHSKLVEKGYYSTKPETLRAGIVRLGQEFGIVSPTEEAWMKLQSEIRRTGKRLPARQVLREHERLETEALGSIRHYKMVDGSRVVLHICRGKMVRLNARPRALVLNNFGIRG